MLLNHVERVDRVEESARSARFSECCGEVIGKSFMPGASVVSGVARRYACHNGCEFRQTSDTFSAVHRNVV